MHATVRHYEGVTDTAEVVRQIKEEGFVEDVLRQAAGFVNYNVVDAGAVRWLRSASMRTSPARKSQTEEPRSGYNNTT